jgi:hypothetical protein
MLTIMLLLFSSLGCSQRDTTRQKKGTTMHDDTIEQVQEQHTPDWMTIPGVVGTAIGQSKGKPCILILTGSNTEQIRKKIPATVDGYPVLVQYTGEIRALDDR